MVTKTIIFSCFIFFLQFYLTSLRGKEYFAKEPEPEPVGARCFWPLGAGAGAARKNIQGAGAAWEKNQEPEPPAKKVRSQSRSR